MKKAALCLLVVLLAAVPASAQGLKQVWITQADSGDVVQGRLVSLSRESLAMLTPDNRRVEIPLDRVLRIETTGDSLKNGAAIGAVVFGGLVAATCASWGGGGECVAASLIDAGLGALIGAGVDAMIAGRTPIYSRTVGTAAKYGIGGDAKRASIGFKIRF
jgi:hypothetical protein